MSIVRDEPTPLVIAGATVLLVDDDPDVRGLMQEYIAAVVAAVFVAASARAAVDILSERMIDVLVTDVILPDGDGFTLARRAVALQPGLRVLYVSGYVEATRQSAGSPRTANFLAKPCRFQEVERALRSLAGV
jgi:DNA-binding NtrC family response regulator